MPMHLHASLPPLEGITEWLNGEPAFDSAPGKPLLVHFWAVSCHICHENMPKLQVWRDKFGPKGLKMIAIHCPRMKTDTDISRVRAACEAYGIVEPCGIDNMHKAKKAFENEIWPAYFLFDKEKLLKRRAAGKTGLSMLEPVIEQLLIE